MDELTQDVGSTTDVGRREILRRGAIVVGATALWTTPIVQTLGMRPAAAQGTGSIAESTLCVGEAGQESSGQPSDLIFRYLGPASQVLIVVQRPGDPDFRRRCVEVGSNGFFTVEGQAGSNWRVGIYDPAQPPVFENPKGDAWKVLPEEGLLLENLEFHTSCSEPLDLGDRFGSLQLVGGTANGDSTAQLLEGIELTGGVKIATSGCETVAEEALEEEALESDDSMSTTEAAEEDDPVGPDAVDADDDSAPVDAQKDPDTLDADDDPDPVDADPVTTE